MDAPFASTVTNYSEDAIALFCGDATYLLYLRAETSDKYHFDLCPCSQELLSEYTRQYSFKQLKKISCMYVQDGLSAIRVDYHERYLSMKATEYYAIELQLLDKLYDPLKLTPLCQTKKANTWRL